MDDFWLHLVLIIIAVGCFFLGLRAAYRIGFDEGYSNGYGDGWSQYDDIVPSIRDEMQRLLD